MNQITLAVHQLKSILPGFSKIIGRRSTLPVLGHSPPRSRPQISAPPAATANPPPYSARKNAPGVAPGNDFLHQSRLGTRLDLVHRTLLLKSRQGL